MQPSGAKNAPKVDFGRGGCSQFNTRCPNWCTLNADRNLAPLGIFGASGGSIEKAFTLALFKVHPPTSASRSLECFGNLLVENVYFHWGWAGMGLGQRSQKLGANVENIFCCGIKK